MLSSLLKGIFNYGTKAAVGYGIYQGANTIADELSSMPHNHVGGFYTGALRTAGVLGGGYIGLSAATKGAGSMLRSAATRIVDSQATRGTAIAMGKKLLTQAPLFKDQILAGTEAYRAEFARKLSYISPIGRGLNRAAKAVEGLPRRLLKLGGWGAKNVSKQIGSALGGIAKSPFVVARDIAHLGRGKGSVIRRLATASHMGARAFGWGALAGAAAGMGGARLSDVLNPTLGVALGGTQTYDPVMGGGPRRGMDPNATNTSGLVQSLHRLR